MDAGDSLAQGRRQRCRITTRPHDHRIQTNRHELLPWVIGHRRGLLSKIVVLRVAHYADDLDRARAVAEAEALADRIAPAEVVARDFLVDDRDLCGRTALVPGKEAPHSQRDSGRL